MEEKDVVVVGAGITGLSIAHYLDDSDFVVLEKSNEPGGVIKSSKTDGKVLELGPQRMRHTSLIQDLIADLKLEDVVVEADMSLPMYVYCDEKLRKAPFSATDFLTTDLLSWRAKLRVLKEPFAEKGERTETVEEYLTKKFGSEAYKNYLGPLFGGIYGSDPGEMYTRHSFSRVLKLEEKSGSLLKRVVKKIAKSWGAGSLRTPAITFDSGNQTLVNALYDANSSNIFLDTPVQNISRKSNSYCVETPEKMLEASHLVLTTPADITAELLGPSAPQISEKLSSLNYNPIALVHLESDADAEGFGYQIRPDEDFDTLGVTWNASIFGHAQGRDSVYTAFLGGSQKPSLLDEPDSVLKDIASKEFEEIMGYEARGLNVHRWHRGFPAYDKSWTALDDLNTPDRLHLCANYESSVGIPGRVREAKRLASELT